MTCSVAEVGQTALRVSDSEHWFLFWLTQNCGPGSVRCTTLDPIFGHYALALIHESRCEGLDVAQVGKIELLQRDHRSGGLRQEALQRLPAFVDIAAGV